MRIWFRITLLHVWMLIVRLRSEKEGWKYAQDLANCFYADVENRLIEAGV